ncbi:MAG: hypothetical protein IKO36_01385 [Bacteroidaceae bacterium]|nr:hypothetical protein [Bacteroidaceae bacterium]
MSRKDTASLLDEYFTTRPETTAKKIRGQIDRPELYAYEKEIGKPLVDMESQEIAEMIKTFSNKSFSNKVYKMSYRTYDTLLSILRDFFNWYIDNYEVIKNPCNDKKIKGRNVVALFADDVKIFDKDAMEEAIERIRNDQIEEYADYQEAIIRMFYEGFPEAIDIVNLKENDINHEKKTAIVKGREIQLSDRLYELLVKINHMDEYPAHRGSYLLLSYRGSYFKFPTRAKFEKEFNDRPPEYWAGHISRLFNRDIKNKLDININARTLYLRGFYDYMVNKVGQEETDRLIMSIRNSDDSRKIMSLAEEYGVVEQNVTTLKKVLMPFVSNG